jgi:TM2 domain-containing membrane protein YozV
MPLSIDQIVVQLTAHMPDEQKLQYIMRFSRERRNPNVALLLSLFLGWVGAQYYYMGRVGKGIVCSLFAWTLVPLVISLYKCSSIRADVQRYNVTKAVELAQLFCPGLQVDFASNSIMLEPLYPVGRTVLAVTLGYVVMLVAQLAGDTALTALVPSLVPQADAPPDPIYFAFRLGTGFFFIAAGGYTAALLAGRFEMVHALSVGALSIAAGILEAMYYAGEQPLWYSIALMFLSIPSALAGGYFRVRQVSRPQATGEIRL